MSFQKTKLFFYGLLLLFGLFVLSDKIYSQTQSQGTAMISGKVLDAESGEKLRKATIAIVGEKLGAYSDVKGEYKIRNVKPGIYTIKVSYVGYATREITNIEVKAGDNLNIDIVLNPAVKTTGDVVVEGYRINDNQAAMLSVRKNAAQVSDGISREEIKRMPDADAGQSLRRVSGITLVSDKFIFVRGVSERYNNTTLNGATLSSTEPDKKAFSFDMFPAEFLENASVAKSFTPDMPGDFAGGLVQLNTVDFPHESSFKINIGSSMNNNVTFKDKTFVTYSGGGNDWLGFDDGTRSLPSLVPATTSEMHKLANDLRSSDETVMRNASQQWVKYGQAFNNNSWKRDSNSAPPNGNFNMSYSDIFNIAGNDFGILASAMYNNGFEKNYIMRGQRLVGNELNYNTVGSQSIFSTNIGGLLNLAYKIGGHTSISIKNTYNNTSEDEVTSVEGFKEQNQIRQIGYHYLHKTLLATQIGGEHTLPILNSVIDWKFGFSKSERDEPDYRRLRYSRNNEDEPYRIDMHDVGSTGYQAGRFFSNLKDNSLSGGLNYSITIDNVKLKAGSFYETKNRDFYVRSFTINKSTTMLKEYYDEDFGYVVPNYGDDEFYNNAFMLNPEDIFLNENFSYTRLGINEETRPIDSYKADESLAAAFIMAEVPLVFGSEKFRVIGGVRFENSTQLLKGYYPQTSEDEEYVYPENTSFDWLPSLNIIYELKSGMNLRMSATRTLTRPSLREISPFSFYDFLFQCDVVGNPNLKRALIQNYDLRWEMFPNPGEVISIGAFYKVFENAIEETIITTSSNLKKSFGNANGLGYNYGLELEFRKGLGFLTHSLSDFMLNVNLALIQSEITVSQVNERDTRPMWGQSPYTLNVGLFYANPEWGTSFNLAYNVYGKRIINVADIIAFDFPEPHVYEMPKNQIDFSITQTIFENFDAKLVVKDLLNEDLIWKQAGMTVASTNKGSSISIGFGYKLK